jgi:hypothetical protein
MMHAADVTKETLLDIDNRRPFQPYALRLNSGDVVRIERPEHCLITEDEQTLIYNERAGRLKFIAIANITMVEEGRGRNGRKR